MNFYSLDGSKIDSNNLFENKQNYERFDNIHSQQNKSSSLDNAIDEDEEFVSVPTSKSTATDTNFQCSDGYVVKGSNLGKKFKNINLNDCKTKCVSAGTDCIGFNFDTKSNVCTLKKNASSMDNNNNSTLCIKKSAGNTKCKVNTNVNANQNNNLDSVKAFNELDSIFNEQTNPINSIQQNKNTIHKIIPIPNSINPISISNTDTKPIYPMEIPAVKTTNQNINTETEIETEMKAKKITGPNMGNNPPGVYVDLDCFMKNINVLQNRTDNMMIDLSLLLSNIKTCSYIKKTTTDHKLSSKNNKMNSKQLLEQITSKINIPQPDTVQLKNIKADVLVSSGANSPSQILEVAKEPFTTDSKSNTHNWDYKDLVFVVIIVILIYLLIFRK